MNRLNKTYIKFELGPIHGQSVINFGGSCRKVVVAASVLLFPLLLSVLTWKWLVFCEVARTRSGDLYHHVTDGLSMSILV